MLSKTTTFVLLLMAAMTGLLPAQSVTTASLLREMTDLQALAEKSQPAFSVVQYSSYDHRSQFPDTPNWFGNSDGFGGEPVPGFEKVLKQPGADKIGEYLICDVKGPGAVVRLWTAWIEGTIKLYIDGQGDPVYDGPAQKFFHHTYEAIDDSEVRPEWAGSFFQNTAGYYPIPFSKSLKIIWIGDLSTLHFYHVQVRFYESGARIKSFSKGDIAANSSLMNELSLKMNHPENYLDQSLDSAQDFVVHLLPGERKAIQGLSKAGAIQRLACRMTTRDLDAGLRSTLLNISFDAAPWGQVHTPVGDFFGAAPGLNPYTSLPFTVQPDGWMVSRYFMPYRDSATVQLINLGQEEVTVHLRIASQDYQWKDGNSLYFRARWRVDHGLTADPARVFDVPYLLYHGRGRMVGAAAFVMNPTNVPSSYGNWWGEGDEKIFIDGDPKARFIGTGSEDYFNYAWSSADLFAHAYCGQPRNDGPANRGFVTNYRWHILDNIPFNQSFDFYMELYPHRLVENFSYARMIYLYASGTGHDDHMPISKPDVVLPEMPQSWWPKPDGWALNAIFYQAEDLCARSATLSFDSSYLWSDAKLAVWYPSEQGAKLVLEVPVSEAGNYLIALSVAKGKGFGTFGFELDGQALNLNGSSQHSLGSENRIVSHNLKSGAIELSVGTHELVILAADDSGLPIGVDFIWVKKN